MQRHMFLLIWTITFSARFVDRPEQRITLDDFKSFLLESQKVISLGFWTSNLLWFVLSTCFTTSVFVYQSRKCGPQTATRFRSSCSATWKTPWEKWNSHISIKMRLVSAHSWKKPKLFFVSYVFRCNPMCCLVYVGDAEKLTWMAVAPQEGSAKTE